jgi:predicted nucleic acid-binding protein
LKALELFDEKKRFSKAKLLSEANIDFADALIASIMESEAEVITFDKDFRKVNVPIRNILEIQ